MKANDVVSVNTSFSGVEEGKPLLVKMVLGTPFLLVTDGVRDYIIQDSYVGLWAEYPKESTTSGLE